MLPPSVLSRRINRATPRPQYVQRTRLERAELRGAACRDHARNRYYILDVSHDIKRTDLPVFINQGHVLVDVIEGTNDLQLQMSGWQIDGEIVHIYNYWRLVNGPESLVMAELKLPDIPVYVRFDNYMLAEGKEILTPISKDVGVPITADDRRYARYVYARVALKVRPTDFAELLARFEALLPAFAYRNGWRLGDTYLGLTGDASTLIQTWAVPDVVAPQVQQKLASAPWASLLQAAPVCAILDPTPSCPLLGDNPRVARTINPPPEPPSDTPRTMLSLGEVPAVQQIRGKSAQRPLGKSAKESSKSSARSTSQAKRKKGSRHA